MNALAALPPVFDRVLAKKVGTTAFPGPVTTTERAEGLISFLSMNSDKTSRPLSEREAADRLGLSQRTLQDWRRRSCGPAFLKLGKRIAYRSADLDAFEASCRVQPKGGVE